MKEFKFTFWKYDYEYDSDVDFEKTVMAESLEDAIKIIEDREPRARLIKQV